MSEPGSVVASLRFRSYPVQREHPQRRSTNTSRTARLACQACKGLQNNQKMIFTVESKHIPSGVRFAPCDCIVTCAFK
jgi:hypothetical protein